MQNIGEEICGEYLKNIKGCDFISYNTTTTKVQGEIDVIGVHLKSNKIYLCEVAVHTKGLGYSKNGKPDDYNRFMSKFKKGKNYINEIWPTFEVIPMIWSPIVLESGPKAKYKIIEILDKLKSDVKSELDLELELIINRDFQTCLSELRKYASSHDPAFDSPVMRIFQIEEKLKSHIVNLNKKMSSLKSIS